MSASYFRVAELGCQCQDLVHGAGIMSTRNYVKYADRRVRILNLLLDILIFHLLLVVMVYAVDIYMTNSGRAELMDSVVVKLLGIRGVLVYLFSVFAYYSLSEVVFGKSPSKFFTRTKVVDEISLQSPPALEVIRRSLCRMSPLDPFSYFSGQNLHDKLSSTCVVHDAKLSRKQPRHAPRRSRRNA
jgi:uncharacterized RDD family membrane protein YckC